MDSASHGVEATELSEQERREWLASRTPDQLAGAAEYAGRGVAIARRNLAQLYRQRQRLCARLGVDLAELAARHPELAADRAERIAAFEAMIAREQQTLAYVRVHTPAPKPPAPLLTRILTRAAPRERRERRRSRRVATARAGPDPDLADEPPPPSSTGKAA